MSQPTIDEMLVWLSKAKHPLISIQQNAEIAETIRAILEQHNQPMTNLMWQQRELAIIRAFVERVRRRVPDLHPEGIEYQIAIADELAAMERENESRS